MVDIPANLQVVNQYENDPGQQLDPEIAHRERCAAGPAAATQQPVADKRDIVFPADEFAALAAT